MGKAERQARRDARKNTSLSSALSSAQSTASYSSPKVASSIGIVSTANLPTVVKSISSGGGSSGGGSSSSNQVNIIQQQLQAAQQRQNELERQERLRQEEAKKAEIRKQILQNQILQESLRREAIAQEELRRIENQRRRILTAGGQKDVRILRDGNTGDRIQITNTNIDQVRRGVVNKQRVFEVKNLDTGETVVKTFERDKKTGRSVQTGGIVTTEARDEGFSQAEPEETRTGLQKVADKASQVASNVEKLILSKSKNYQIKNLDKERDEIYSKLTKVNEKYSDKELTEKEYNKYLSEVASLKNQYKTYFDKKQKILKDLPSKKTISNLEYSPIVGEEVLVLDKKDRTITTSINRGIDKATSKLINNKDVAKNTAILTLLVAGQAGYEFGKGIVMLPKTVKELVKNPSLIKQIPAVLKEEGAATGQLMKVSPIAGLVKLGAEVYLWTKGPGGAIKLTRKLFAQSSKLSKAFRGVKTSSLGIQSIKNVNKVGDIEIILQRGTKLKTNPKAVVKEFSVNNKLKKNPTLPKTTSKVEKEVLALVKKNGDIVTGSFARETLLRKQFSRVHKDLDIASKDIPGLIKLIKARYGNKASFKVKPNSVLVKINGKEIADLVALSKAEAGFIKQFGYKTINGLKIANPQAIIGGKANKLRTIKVGSSKGLDKTLKDLEKLTGQKLVGKASIKGAYGNTKKFNSQYLGKSGPLTTAQADLLVKNILNRNPKLKIERWLYATPWEIRTGKAQVRVSRLALKSEEGTILDLLRGRATLKASKPQIFVLPKQKIFKAGTKLTKSKTIPTKKGFVIPNFTSELEVVLGKGYIISRGKKLGVTLISGEKVPIIELKLTKLTPELRRELNLLDKLKNKLGTVKNKTQRQKLINEIDRKELSLNNKLKKKTGFDYFSRRPTRRVYPLKKKVVSRATKIRKVTRTKVKRVNRRPTTRKVRGRTRVTPRRTTPRRPTARRPTRTTRRPTARTPVPRRPRPRRPTPRRPRPRPPVPRPPKKPPIRRPSSKKKAPTTRGKGTTGYNVYVKSRGKYLKANRKPLSKRNALDRRAYVIDHSTSVRAKLRKIGKTKTLGKIKPKEVGARTKVKARNYRIVKGKRVYLQGTIIERKGKPRINTRGEKRGLTAARLVKQLNTPTKRKKRTVKRKK